MNKKMKTILSLVGFALFIALAVFAYNRLSDRTKPADSLVVFGGIAAARAEEAATPEPTPEPAPTQAPERQPMMAPEFTVQDMEGNEVKLSDMRGRPVVVNFWASWCPPCKYEMPEFEQVYQEIGEDVVFLMVDMVDGQRETREKGAKYIEDEGYTFPVYFDIDQQTAITYGVMSIPTTYFIDAEGYLIAGAQSAIDAETLMRGIGMIAP